MSDAAMETELKFTLSEAALDPLRWEVFEGRPVRHLRAIYYDTPDFALARRRTAVRLRHDDGRWVQTVKGSGAVRRFEDEVVTDGPALVSERVIAALEDAPADLVTRLAPVFEVEVDRRTLVVEHGGASIELALDEGVVRAGGAQTPIRELELELKSGDLADLFGSARGFASRDGVMLSLTSKAERGYRAIVGRDALAELFPTPSVSPAASVGEAFQALGLAHLGELAAAAEAITGVGSGDALHRARVALRRLRVIFAAFRPAAQDERFEALKAELKRATGLFADARSLDVFSEDTPSLAGSADAGLALERARAAAYTRLRDEMRQRLPDLLLDLAQWLLCGAWLGEPAFAEVRDASIRPFAERALRHRRRRLLKRGHGLDWANATARHRVRIEAKKLRYLIDAFATVDGHGGLKRLKTLQALLGELNDAATAGDTARRVVNAGASPLAALVIGMAVGERQGGEARLIRRAHRAFRRWARHLP